MLGLAVKCEDELRSNSHYDPLFDGNLKVPKGSFDLFYFVMCEDSHE